MFEKLSLLEESKLDGTNIDDFANIVSDIDKRRLFIPVKPDELNFVLADDVVKADAFIDEPMVFGSMYPIKTKDDARDKRTYTGEKLAIDKFICKLNPVELKKECLETGVFMTHPAFGSQLIPVTASAIRDLCALVGIYGSVTNNMTSALLQFIVEMAKNHFNKVEMNPFGDPVLRVDGASQKDKADRTKEFSFTATILKDENDPSVMRVFSFRSGGYAPIEQKNVVRCIDSTYMLGMGEQEFKYYHVDHHLTKSMISFPAVAEEFSRDFVLDRSVTPCFLLRTSDTGRSALAIQKYVQIGENYHPIPELHIPEIDADCDIVFTRHFGCVDIGKLMERMKDKLFRTFRAIPKRMADLASAGEMETEKALHIAFNAMGFQRKSVIISEELQMEIEKKLLEDLPKTMDTLNVVMVALEAADDPNLEEILTEKQKEELQKRALLALFGDYTPKSASIAI